jgi:citrate lyase subunit beta / citryl-CoA lyase
MTGPFEPLRSLLFVPADRVDRVGKAAASGADAVILDLEDGVGQDRKDVARSAIADGVATVAKAGVRVIVRINQGGAGREEADRFKLLPIDAFMLPKVEDTDAVTAIAAVRAGNGAREGPTGLIPLIESPAGVLAAATIARCDPSVVALSFGGEDYAADMGVEPGPEELDFPARMVAVAARAAGLPSFGIIGSIADVRDEAAFELACRRARGAGFAGALAIHPTQVRIANRVFSPTDAERDWALGVLEDIESGGSGAIRGRDGRMIDRPVVERARRLLSRAARRP